MAKVILASGSPRRRELLASLNVDFTVQPSQVEERRAPDETPAQYVARLALEKAAAVAQDLSAGIVVGADTVVVIDGLVLEKPADPADAKRMLRTLSGRSHQVLTGLCLVQVRSGAEPKIVSGVEMTEVLFQALSEEEIDWYLTTGEPFDKAGAYAIQGYGALLVDKIQGNYFNVVGLPLNLLFQLAKTLGEEVRYWK